MGQVYKIDARLKQGETTSLKETLYDFSGMPVFRRIVFTVVPLIFVAIGCWAISELSSTGRVADASATISTSVNTTRRLYQNRPDVGEGTIMVSLILSRQFNEKNVKVKWSENGLLDLKNEFGGRLDVVAMKNHFELHYYSVPPEICSQLVTLFADKGMPVWVNTLPVQLPSKKAIADASCSAMKNNLVWKFR